MIVLDTIKLILAIILTLYLPGYFLLKNFEKKTSVNPLEKMVLSFGLSLFLVDFIFLLIDKTGLAFNFWTVFLSLVFLSLGLFVFSVFSRHHHNRQPNKAFAKESPKKEFLILLLIFFAVAIRLFFLSERLLPQTTDLGHHMYWSQYIIEFKELPDYGMPDFIIGEHIIFAAISILSGISVISPMPIALLFLINIFSLLVCWLAIYELARCFTDKESSDGIAVFTLLSLGIFYAVSSPQAKFVSGGVIGNIIGNFLIPLSFFLLVKFARTRQAGDSVFMILILATLAYTHHLSAFIFLYVFAGVLFLLLIFVSFFYFLKKEKTILAEIWNFIRLFLSWKTLTAILMFLFFIFFIRTPSYLNPSAIDTAVGAPSKDTRTGLTLGTIIETTGAWRFFYGTIGIVVLITLALLWTKKRKSSKALVNMLISVSLLLGWGIMIFFMSHLPKYLKVDIPSNRIGSYITYPFALLSAIGAFYLLTTFKTRTNNKLLPLFTLMVIGVGFVSGLTEISANKKTDTDNKEICQTYSASKYLKGIVSSNENILKDHIYLAGDAWIKIFFMKDYKYPLSRSYLKRYDDPVKPRETCTRDMIAIPDSDVGRKCFLDYGVKYVMLKKNEDTFQFESSRNFSKIFSNGQVVIYQRNY
jgi:hypothetical protein